MGVLSQLRAAAHPEPAAPQPAPSETGQTVAVSAPLTVAWHLVTPGYLAACFFALVAGWLWALPPLAMLLATARELAVGLVLLGYPFLARRRGHLFAAAVSPAMAVAYRAVVALQRARHLPRLLGLLAARAVVPLVDVADGQLTLNHRAKAPAFTVILMTLTALALWWPRLTVRHG